MELTLTQELIKEEHISKKEIQNKILDNDYTLSISYKNNKFKAKVLDYNKKMLSIIEDVSFIEALTNAVRSI